jgi:hypothetical protein
MKTIFVCFALLCVLVQADPVEPSPQVTISCSKLIWKIVPEEGPQMPGTIETIRVELKNTLQEERSFTDFVTLLPFLDKKDDQKILFVDRGCDHSRLPNRTDFPTLNPGDKVDFFVNILLSKATGICVLWYECPSGETYSCTVQPGDYELGIRYQVRPDFFDNINKYDPRPANYHLTQDDTRLLWTGAVNSNLIPIQIRK